MAKAFGIVTSSPEHKVNGMQDYRPIGAFSFLGRYRVVDFPISNFSNSGIINLQVYISLKPRSIVSHIGTGRHYNINSKRGKIQLLFPAEKRVNPIYNTNISQFMDNIDYIRKQPYEYVVIAPSCMVFKANFDEFLQNHVASGADISMMYHKVHHAKSDYSTCNFLDIDGDKVTAIALNHGDEDVKDISMETYVMKKDLLIDLIYAGKEISSMYNLANVINAKLSDLDVRAVEHTGYFCPITSLASYFDANMQLLNPKKAAELFTPDWPIYTRTSDSCPTQFFDEAEVKNSLVSNGCEIHGIVTNSVIGRGVTIAPGTVVNNCIIMAHSTIGENVHIENQIVDKEASITHENEIIGSAEVPGYIVHSDVL